MDIAHTSRPTEQQQLATENSWPACTASASEQKIAEIALSLISPQLEKKSCMLPLEYEQVAAILPSMTHTLWYLFSMFTGPISHTTALLTDAVKNNVLDDNHPWKQKKYELAISELLSGFQKLSNYELELLPELLENDTRLKNSVLKEHLLDLLKKMLFKTNDARCLYYDILASLRLVLSCQEFKEALTLACEAYHRKEPLDLTVKLVLALCESRYTQVHLYSFCEYLVDRLIEHPGNKHKVSPQLVEEDFKAISQASYSTMGAVRASVNKGKLQGWANVNFDPAMQQNIPYVLADIPLANLDKTKIKLVRFIRMGCPTIEGFVYRASVAPEYEHFLLARYFQQKTHLYISLQSDLPHLAGDESSRNRACRELQAKHANFFYVVLDQDSDFYRQTGAFSHLSWEEFIATFKERLFGLNTGYDFPLSWKLNPNFVLEIEHIFDVVSKLLCQAEACATVEQRCNFIEIFQALLVIFCVRFSEVDSVNVTCKDAIDRAMKTLSLLLQIVIIGQGNADSPFYQKIHKVCTHAPAFLVKKQPIVDNRRARLMSAYALINSVSVKALLMQEAERLGIVGNSFDVHAKAGQQF